MKIDTKDAIIFGCGIITLIAGIALAFIGIYMPPAGEISGSVLAGIGQFLTFAGSCLGITSYTAIKLKEIEYKTKNKSEEDI